jgi:hypothetical protein
MLCLSVVALLSVPWAYTLPVSEPGRLDVESSGWGGGEGDTQAGAAEADSGG